MYIEIGDTAESAEVGEETSGKKMKRFRVVNRFNMDIDRHCPSATANLSCCHAIAVVESRELDRVSFVITRGRRQGLPVHRLARKILGSTVGVALGGGAAFGIAHLGVLQVLEKYGIPIDLIAGCSQGSIIGVGYAAGVSAHHE